MSFINNKWKSSKVRFYLLNAKWNYSFWLFCKRKYAYVSYIKINPIKQNREKVIKKRFLGYEYKGKLYEDNPGMPMKSNSDWKIWRKKGLINL